MNNRQRTIETYRFGHPDRIPLDPGWGRKSTQDVWRKQGLPADVTDANEYAYRQAGGKLPWPKGGPGFSVNERMIPQFEEKILEERGDSRIVQDWKGNICEISSEFGVEYLRNPIDFVTRRWVKCPVETRADWEAMKLRYDPATVARLPADAVAQAAQLQERDWMITINFSGPFWQLREWLGFENLCVLFHDDPVWIAEMTTFWSDYIAALLERTLTVFKPDMVHLAEDMAYKQFSMISPAMAREFLLPVWARWGEIIRRAGVPLYGMDSDGYIGELIPLWIEAGINVCDPIGNDIAVFRKQFGREMAYLGGVDKRAMARGGKVLEDEIARLRPVIDDGGYIPSCDHGVPSDVSWPNYVRYVELLAKATGW